MRFALTVLVWFSCLSLLLTGCSRRKEIWIYTSLPREVITEMVEPLQAAVPQADVKWYQSASDNVATRLSEEFEEEEVKADLVLISDPLWYLDMKKKGHLVAYDSPAAKDVPSALKDPEGNFCSVRLSAMVLGYDTAVMKGSELPERWKDLTHTKWNRKVSMGSPFESALSFVTVAQLSKLFGWEYFAELRKQGLVAEGTNTSVLTRIETGERPLGILPLENLLRMQAKNPGLKAVYPQDGIIAIPGPIAIMKTTDHLEIAKKVYDWFFSLEAQNKIVKAGVYSPLPQVAAPEGARPASELMAQLAQMTREFLPEIHKGRDRIRAKFSEVVLH